MSVDTPVKPELDAAEIAERAVTQHVTTSGPSRGRKVWDFAWPKLLAIAIVVAIWQFAYWQEWKPHFLLPSPLDVFSNLKDLALESRLWEQIGLTMRRGVTGFGIAIAIGTLIGIAVVQWRTLRLAIHSLIAGLQTMPSIAWFPLAILFFGLTETAILFVVVLGAAPSIASGVISGIDEVPPPLLRAGKMIGATGVNRYRYIVLPAAMPAYLAGLKQGWAFSWRSLLAGELLVSIGGSGSLGSALNFARTTGNTLNLFSFMIVILIVGIVIDALFGVVTKRVRENRGLTGTKES
jgi:NitT/TauT family transport system permease protein